MPTRSDPPTQDGMSSTTSQRVADPPDTSELPSDLETIGPVERASLMEYFGLISRRLSQLEDAVRAKQTDSPRTASWIEFSKIVLGGWPVFGLLLIVMFYD